MILPLAASLLAAAVAAAPGRAPDSLTIVSRRGEAEVAVRVERGWPAIAPASLGDVLSVTVPAPGPAAASASVTVAGRRFEFLVDATYFRFEGRTYALAAASYLARDTLFVPLQWATEYLPSLLAGRFRYDPARLRLEELSGGSPTAAGSSAVAPPPSPPPPRRYVVALDPGHGGPDVGMVGPMGRRPFLYEKNVTLAVARDLADELRRRGVGAVLTRTRDTLIALEDRGRIAGEDSADIFVSIHVNAANPRWRDAASTRGIETYFLAEAKTEDARRVERMENASVRFETSAPPPSSDAMKFILNDLAQNEHLRESERLADIIENQLGYLNPTGERGVKQAGFMVLATSYMPAVLVEIGYGTNPAEARYLTSPAGQRAIARAVAGGIVQYLAGYQRRLAGARRRTP